MIRQSIKSLAAIGLLGLLYYIFGMAGLMVESTVKGITPIWPPSGITIAAVLLFGYRLLPGVVMGMVLLALTVGIPWTVMLLAATGSVLEAAIPVALLRKFNFKGEFNELSDVLVFSGFAVLLGPVFSATLGATAFTYFNPGITLSFFEIWILWWLGNSLGILVIGSFLLEWHNRVRIDIKAITSIVIISAVASVICFFSLNLVEGIYSTLLLFTILPLTVLSAICCEVKGSTFVTSVILLIFISSGAWLSADVFSTPDISFFYLNAAFIAINAFIGMVVGTSVRKHKVVLELERRYSNEAEQLVFKRTSELEAAQQQLTHAQKSEAIATLAGGIAHEFNNLLTPILGYAQMLETTAEENSNEKKYIQQIQQAGKRAGNLVKQILAYGRESMGQKQTVQLDSIVDDAINLIKHTLPANITIIKQFDGDDFHINAMPNEIHQIILNLCINASQSMPDGGTLTINLKNDGKHRFINQEGLVREGQFMCLSIQDTGDGMSQETIDRIFDPFFTTKEVGEGTGLGLSVVYGIVEQHQGHMLVESKLGKGSTFKVYLPLSNEIISPAFHSNQELLLDKQGGILLIDDEQMVIDFTRAGLENMGYIVEAFTECTEALRWLKDHHDKIDLVITDFGMASMDGKELAKQVKDIRPELPVILMTGYGELVSHEDIHLWGMEDLLLKPFELNELSHMVSEVLKNKTKTL